MYYQKYIYVLYIYIVFFLGFGPKHDPFPGAESQVPARRFLPRAPRWIHRSAG